MKVFQKTDSYAQNDHLEDLADPAQLEAAAYMHDVGMMFLPEGMWLNKLGRLNEDDKKALRAHPGYGAGLLERMEGWGPAAEMMAQHHEPIIRR